jgi:hypothetical protein
MLLSSDQGNSDDEQEAGEKQEADRNTGEEYRSHLFSSALPTDG